MLNLLNLWACMLSAVPCIGSSSKLKIKLETIWRVRTVSLMSRPKEGFNESLGNPPGSAIAVTVYLFTINWVRCQKYWHWWPSIRVTLLWLESGPGVLRSYVRSLKSGLYGGLCRHVDTILRVLPLITLYLGSGGRKGPGIFSLDDMPCTWLSSSFMIPLSSYLFPLGLPQ